MLKRFLQNNILLVVILSVSLVAVFVLLALAALKHMEMREASGDVSRLIEKIRDIQRGQKIAPVQENLDRINRDIALYDRKVAESASLYGLPFGAACDAMAQKLGLKDGAEMRKKFMELYESKKGNSTRGQIYDTFKREFGDKWEPAIEEFRRQADLVMVERVDDRNKDAILLDQIGIARNSDKNPVAAGQIARDVQAHIAELYKQNKIKLDGTAAKLAMLGFEQASEATIVSSLRLLEIASDLARRISKSGIASLDELSVEKANPTADEDGYIFYCFNVQVTGKLPAIRKLVDLLNSASMEKRFYAVQSLSLSRCADEADDVLNRGYEEEESKPQPPPQRGVDGNPAKAAESQTPVIDEKKLAFNERKGYARTVLGKDEYCNAVMGIVYVIKENK